MLALYPETTSFYRATVQQPARREGGKYKLAFVDDGDNVLDVTREFVVAVSLLLTGLDWAYLRPRTTHLRT